jgi:sialic acid synthase SpsE
MDRNMNEADTNHTYIIAEAGLNHNGSIDIAKKLIDVAVSAGADAVKFQKRTVDKLAVQSVLDAADDRFPDFGKTYREIREHIEFDLDAYRELKAYAEERGIEFLCTAFDEDAVDFLETLGIQKYKLASHSLTNLPLLRYLADIGKPVFLSTGMAALDEIDQAVDVFKERGTPLVLFHCISAYPTPIEESNLAMIDVLKERYGLRVGYSGHEIGYQPTLAAVAMGACAIERHFTLDSTMVGFDHKLSLEPDALTQMIKEIRAIALMYGSGQKVVSETEMVTRRKYHVSMVSVEALPKGAVLSQEMVSYRNPGTGILPKDADKILGLRAKAEIPANVILMPEMFE